LLFTYIYLLRVPLTLGLFLATFAPLALFKSSQVTTLLEGMFDLNWPRIAVASLTTLLAGGAFAVCTEMVLRYAYVRFGVRPLTAWLCAVKFQRWGLEIARFTILNVVFYVLCTVPMLGGFIYAGRGSLSSRISGVLLGVTLFAALLATVIWIWANSLPTVSHYLGSFFLWTPNGYIQTPEQKLRTIADTPEEKISDKHRQKPLLLSGHGFVSAALGVTIFVYALLGIARWFEINWHVEHRSAANTLPLVPTVACVLLLLTLISYLLSGLGFLLDRFRVPVLIPLLIVAVAQGSWPQADHFFPSIEDRSIHRLSILPTEVLNQGDDSAVVVATSGGGIQAAAWTATVLSRLQLEVPGDLARSVRLISSVSGGSIGTMYYVGAFEDGTIDKTKIRQKVFEPSTVSVLDDIAWGMVYPDFVRIFLPFFGWVDRGWAAENGWLRFGSLDRGLSSWRPLTKQGKLPAVIFNATIEETGGRFLMSTTDLTSHAKGRGSFYDLYPDSDISIVTAARLSASFPYVSPAARIKLCVPTSKAYHFVDGGYYDNYGVSSLIDWLNEATQGQGSVKHILILQIRGPIALEETAAKRTGGLLYQLAAPLSTLVHFRSEGQISHNDAELNLFIEAARQRNIGVESAIFQYPKPDTPLSWHLTPSEITDVWAEYDHCDAHFGGWDLCSNRDHVKRFMSKVYNEKATP
jgi:predicted acylesterase/phospholipase RssA